LVAPLAIANKNRSDCDIMALDWSKINSTADRTRQSFGLARIAFRLQFSASLNTLLARLRSNSSPAAAVGAE
jgi:hypothetical protein